MAVKSVENLSRHASAPSASNGGNDEYNCCCKTHVQVSIMYCLVANAHLKLEHSIRLYTRMIFADRCESNRDRIMCWRRAASVVEH
jgi:hypothetical protein